MNAWCTADEVGSRVLGKPSRGLLQEFADQATDILYVMSGRRFGGTSTVVATHQVDRRGYVKLAAWAPVQNVVSVTVDGIAVSSFALSPAGTYLVLPIDYRLQLVTLTLQVGQNPPPSGKDAAASLAAELLRADPRYSALGQFDDIRPANRITSISRQGVSYSFADPRRLAEAGMTGVYEVDLFIRAVNPKGVRYQPKVVTA